MKKYILVLCIVFGLFIQETDALGMGFWDKMARYLITEHKIHTKNKEKEKRLKEPKRKDRPITQKDHARALKDIEDWEKPPLERHWLQRIEVYEELLKENDSPKTIRDIITHIEITGEKKYGKKLSQKHKELLEKLRKKQEERKKDPAKEVEEKAIGLTILGGIAYIIKVIVFKVPM